jgi:rare lipoprotein A (peptidoglycan hydrolase)
MIYFILCRQISIGEEKEVQMKRMAVCFTLVIFATASLIIPGTCSAQSSFPMTGIINYSLASWYGPNFQGKLTASGQVFDMHSFTCAHKEYPFGTWLRITNIMNEKTTFCMVNDRGPFNPKRELDLSYAAAKMLDMITLGTCVVRIEYLGMDSKYLKAIGDFFKNRYFVKSLRH